MTMYHIYLGVLMSKKQRIAYLEATVQELSLALEQCYIATIRDIVNDTPHEQELPETTAVPVIATIDSIIAQNLVLLDKGQPGMSTQELLNLVSLRELYAYLTKE